jgi:serine/threonine protein kinase
MALPAGTRLGPYEIVALLGAGGMGEVYRARDTRLDRDVAIKILPERLSADPEARQRFDREARAISALNHPNICHLYDVGEQDSTSYLVMEYLEGETLSDRLKRGRLPLDQVFRIGSEICEGLARAHRSGIFHRDLKPGNIMLTRSGAKLMDFGLAKASSTSSRSLSLSMATMSQPLTTEGTIIGTVQYMAPEQLEGKEADQRSDIFAFGAVLYEMVTGRRAFDGKTTASTIAAILATEPQPLTATQPLSPPALEHLIKICLAKDPEERFQSAQDVKTQLQWIAANPTTSSIAPAPPAVLPRRRVSLGWWLAGLLLLLLFAQSLLWWLNSRPQAATMYFSSPFSLAANDVALSPDGKTVALVAYAPQTNKYMLWTYAVGARDATMIAGTEDARHPFWSGDGRSLAFFASGKLKTVDAFSPRSPQVLTDAPNGRGGAWNREGVILFSPDTFSGIYRIPAGGGTPQEITRPDHSRMEQSHRWPSFLPDQHHFLYLGANFGGHADQNIIVVGSLDGKESHRLLNVSSNAAYADPGYLLFQQGNSVLAQPFDTRSFTLSGRPTPVADDVQYFPQTDLALFAVSGTKTLVVQTGKGFDKSQLVWFDRNGKQLGAMVPPGMYANVAISRDGRRVAFDQIDADGHNVDIWVRDLASDAAVRLTFRRGLNQQPVWSPDGKQLAFSSNEDVAWGLSHKSADGSGQEQYVLRPTDGRVSFWDWSPDGQDRLIGKDEELYYLHGDSQELKPLLPAKHAAHNAQFSPDGHWIAYSSNETGTREIYISPFPSVSSKWLVSRGGGTEPRWRNDGKELYYLSPEGKVMAVNVKLGAAVESGTPLALFQPHLHQSISAMDVVSYDVAPDGQRFLISVKEDTPTAAPLSFILNWAAELEK